MPRINVQLVAGGGAAVQGAAMVAGDEPAAVLAARDILAAGGAAADAAVTLGLTLAVTLPSQAGLGGGGACLVHDAQKRATEVVDFRAPAAADDSGARFRAAVPATAHGLFALHARYGALPWAQVVAPAETTARFGTRVSRAFAQDLSASGDALAGDRTALTAFMTPRRQMVQAGDNLVQLNLAATLARIRARGPGDFADLSAFVPRWTKAAETNAGVQSVFSLPEDVAGGAEAVEGQNGATGFVIADGRGTVVACVLTMGRAFGLGIMPAQGGFLLAPAPDAPGASPPRLAASIAVNRVTAALLDAETRTRFVNKLACSPAENATPICAATADVRGAGYAFTLNPRDQR